MILVLCLCVRARGVLRRLVELSLVSGGVYWFCGDRASTGLGMALVLIVGDVLWLGYVRFFCLSQVVYLCVNA